MLPVVEKICGPVAFLIHYFTGTYLQIPLSWHTHPLTHSLTYSVVIVVCWVLLQGHQGEVRGVVLGGEV